jgi:hypothetical protein
MAVRKTSLICILALTGCLPLTGAAAPASSPDPAPTAAEAVPMEPEADPVNRITMARFARSFGRLTRDIPPEQLIEDPAGSLDADALRSALSESGLERRDWDELLKRMRDDEDFRDRVETLSASYRLGH